MNICPYSFRAWNGHKMCRVDSLSFNAGGMIWHGPGEFGWGWIDESFTGWTKDNPKPEVVNPVMRFTELYDKNGRAIWEGDIFKTFNTRCLYEVVFNDQQESFAQYTGFKLRVYDKEGDMTKDKEIFQKLSSGPESLHYEIIGDIYSTPDLLKS
jgi:hypothetical protein